MVKYVKEDIQVVFSEIPDEITLAINVSNCPHHCKGCHSSYLRKDIGDELTTEVLDELINKNDGITCVCFMGEGNDFETLFNLAKCVRKHNLKVGLYTGMCFIDEYLYYDIQENFDYIKLGEYIDELGPINKKTTNQRMYKIVMNDNKDINWFNDYKWIDITNKFWNK